MAQKALQVPPTSGHTCVSIKRGTCPPVTRARRNSQPEADAQPLRRTQRQMKQFDQGPMHMVSHLHNWCVNI